MHSFKAVLGPFHGQTLYCDTLKHMPILSEWGSLEEIDGEMKWVKHQKRTEHVVVWVGTYERLEL